MYKSNRNPGLGVWTGAALAGVGLAAWAVRSRRRAPAGSGRGAAGRDEVLRRCSATVITPIAEVYRCWREPQERARFGAQAAPHFLEEKPPYLLSWRPERQHAPFHIVCSLRLEPIKILEPPLEATEVRLQTRITLPPGAAPRPLARKLLQRAGAQISRRQMDNLFRMKQLAETGEIATTTGQSSGRRSLVVRTLQPLDRPDAVAQRLRGVG